MAVLGDPCGCPCTTPQICSFGLIAKRWRFTVPAGTIVNNTCALCAGFTGTWDIVWEPLSGFWFSQPQALVACYADTLAIDSAWVMVCELDFSSNLHFALSRYSNNKSRYCTFPHQDSFDLFTKDAAVFDPIGPNILDHTVNDTSDCRDCDLSGLPSITITPVF